MDMAEIVFILCAVMSGICALALTIGYRKSRNRLLLWSALCFLLLAINNFFLCFDLLLFPTLNLDGPFWRNLLTAASGILLLAGLITETT